MRWVGLFLAPLAFLAHLQVGYWLVLYACGNDALLWVHLGAAAFATIAAVGTAAAWLTWQRAGATKPGEEGGPAASTRLLGIAGLGVGAVMTLILLAQFVATFVTPPCS